MSKKQLTMVGAIVVVAIGVGIAAWTGIFPPRPGVEGTVGGAKRYQAQQIRSADVVLQDANVQAFLQTDLFHQIATDDKLRKLILDARFQSMARNRAYFEVAGGVSEMLRTPTRKQLLESEGYAELLKRNKAFREISEQEMAKQIFANKRFLALARETEFVEALKNPKLAKLLEACEAEKVRNVQALQKLALWKSVVEDPALSEMMRRAQVQEVITAQEVQSIGTEPALLELLESSQVVELLNEADWQELMNHADLLKAITSEEMAAIWTPLESLLRDDGAAELLQGLNDPALLEACKRSEFRDIAEANALERAITANVTE